MLRRLCVLVSIVVLVGSCASQSPPAMTPDAPVSSDTIEARRLFEDNIGAIHKRDRARYLSTYIHSPTLARNGPSGLELGYADWSATRDTTWPDTLVAERMRVVPLARGVVFGTYCYRVTQNRVTTSGVSERVFIKTLTGWKIAVTTAFGLPAGAPAQCK
ncbi:MAG: hypothetical protein M3O61_00250 [Gemmatimonadota bacterium]|nr:hypothetical protein [Gemmatimonadota bacterium]